jgi:DHA1 family bicyclomycin/chloramphenicol resistance-like MFS transporter
VIYAVFLVFLAVAPYLLAESLGRPATDFGLYYMLISAGYFLGNLYVTRRGSATSPARVTSVGLWLQFGSAAAGLGFVLAGLNHPAWLFGPMLPLAFGQGLALPHITARAVSMAPRQAGTASSFVGFSQQAMAAVSVQGMGFASTATAVPVMLYCTVASGLALLPLFVFREPRIAHSRG